MIRSKNGILSWRWDDDPALFFWSSFNSCSTHFSSWIQMASDDWMVNVKLFYEHPNSCAWISFHQHCKLSVVGYHGAHLGYCLSETCDTSAALLAIKHPFYIFTSSSVDTGWYGRRPNIGHSKCKVFSSTYQTLIQKCLNKTIFHFSSYAESHYSKIEGENSVSCPNWALFVSFKIYGYNPSKPTMNGDHVEIIITIIWLH